MTMPEKDKISKAIADRDLITKALAEGVKDALIRHKETGNPVVVMRDGKIIWIKAEELLAGYPLKIAWLTDLHLNCVGRSEVEDLCTVIHRAKPDALLITGDIAASKHLCRYLEFLADSLRKPIYFVLGNHDYYGSSIKQVNSEVARTVKNNQYLIWLSRSSVIELSPDTCLIGHEGLADGRLGDPLRSTVALNDYRHIEE